jgi:SagB-type dehydrogenase family enzyme
MAEEKRIIELPKPTQAGQFSLGQLLQQRRSLREYSSRPVNLTEVGQLLWAAQGITHSRGLRTAPSAGALYPLELYVVAGNVTGLEAGVYHYQIHKHRLVQHVPGDKRKALAQAAYMQTWLSEAPVVFVFSADYKRTSKKYGKRAKRYVHMEVGHAGQNLFLQAQDLGLGSVVVGAFFDEEVADLLQLPSEFSPLALMPVGKE